MLIRRLIMHLRFIGAALLSVGVLALQSVAVAADATVFPVTGAIWTTDVNGNQVDGNIYAALTDVYLNGGPGLNAPPTAGGLPDGTFVFMVTDPSGKTLLSLDAAQCREFVVSGGNITGVTGPCPHQTGGTGNGGVTVQLFPFSQTPNNGGEFKAWATPLGDFPAACLATVDCSTGTHGFTPSMSKTDNFKTKAGFREVDTNFFLDLNHSGSWDPNEPFLSGLSVAWTDTLGASNVKWADPANSLEAHAEALEAGSHSFTVASQPGCTVTQITVAGSAVPLEGPGTFTITISQSAKTFSL